jgi:hypothetical protein
LGYKSPLGLSMTSEETIELDNKLYSSDLICGIPRSFTVDDAATLFRTGHRLQFQERLQIASFTSIPVPVAKTNREPF